MYPATIQRSAAGRRSQPLCTHPKKELIKMSPITRATREQIEENIARSLWNTDMLDRRGLPLTYLNTEDGVDPWLAGANLAHGSGEGSKALRAFINSPEARLEVAKTNEAVAQQMAEEESESVAEQFSQETPDYYPDDDYKNYGRLVEDLVRVHLGKTRMDPDEGQAALFARGHWTVPNLKAAYARLAATGHMIPKPGARKQLSDDELTRVTSLVRFGDAGQAIVQYISYALNGLSDRDYASPQDLLTQYPALSSEASTYVWAQLRFISQADLDSFLPTIRGVKILSVGALDTLFARWENRRNVSALYTELEDQPTAEGFEDLSDSEVKQLMNESILAQHRNRGR